MKSSTAPDGSFANLAPRFQAVVAPTRAGGRQWAFVIAVAAVMAGFLALLVR